MANKKKKEDSSRSRYSFFGNGRCSTFSTCDISSDAGGRSVGAPARHEAIPSNFLIRRALRYRATDRHCVSSCNETFAARSTASRSARIAVCLSLTNNVSIMYAHNSNTIMWHLRVFASWMFRKSREKWRLYRKTWKNLEEPQAIADFNCEIERYLGNDKNCMNLTENE